MISLAEELAYLLRSVVKETLRGVDSAGLLFSGGLDSSILAILSRKECDITLYVLGAPDSHDAAWAAECASMIDMPMRTIPFDETDALESMKTVVLRHGMTNPKWMSTFTAFDLLLRKVEETNVLCGQGADEVFGGYRKYSRSADIRSAMNDDIGNLLEKEYPAYEVMAANYNKWLIAPYLDRRLVELGSRIPADANIDSTGNKLVLRKAAEILGVPGMMAQRPKKAMQYGSGVSKTIRKCLKNMGADLDSFIEDCTKCGK
jgi:asparagine synthase (glutamine-hydrolysing)